MMSTIYLDYAAATPIDDGVLAAMQPYFVDKFYNPAASYLSAKTVHDDIKRARAVVASLLGVRPAEIVFTAGGSEANNLAIVGVLQAFPGAHTVTTALEHDSVRQPLKFLETRGNAVTEVMPKADGIIDPEVLANAVTDETVLVSVMQANNEIGTIQPLKQIAEKLSEIRSKRAKSGNDLPLYFHTDACQAANYLDLHAHRLGVDLMMLNGGKIYGPKQSGALFVASHVKLTPLIHGGGQERGLRSGTENVSAIVGFAKALEIATDMRPNEVSRLQTLQKKFIELLSKNIQTVQINGSQKHRLPNNVHITISGTDNERIIFALDGLGIECAAGSACSASKAESSHVLKALGLSDENARSSLRFSMGRATTETDIQQVASALAKLTAKGL